MERGLKMDLLRCQMDFFLISTVVVVVVVVVAVVGWSLFTVSLLRRKSLEKNPSGLGVELPTENVPFSAASALISDSILRNLGSFEFVVFDDFLLFRNMSLVVVEGECGYYGLRKSEINCGY